MVLPGSSQMVLQGLSGSQVTDGYITLGRITLDPAMLYNVLPGFIERHLSLRWSYTVVRSLV